VHAFFVEAFGTGILVFVTFALTALQNPLNGAAIPPLLGSVYGILVFTLGPLTGYVSMIAHCAANVFLGTAFCVNGSLLAPLDSIS
jgi:glycerol uptake facilitator-like aquaporin